VIVAAARGARIGTRGVRIHARATPTIVAATSVRGTRIRCGK